MQHVTERIELLVNSQLKYSYNNKQEKSIRNTASYIMQLYHAIPKDLYPTTSMLFYHIITNNSVVTWDILTGPD